MYLVRYGMGVSNLEEASFSVTTPNISILLTLPVPDGLLNMVVYNIWVAVVTKSKEHGNATVLIIQYSSELQLVTGYHSIFTFHMIHTYPIILYISAEVAESMYCRLPLLTPFFAPSSRTTPGFTDRGTVMQ